jgi:hypothetical protein
MPTRSYRLLSFAEPPNLGTRKDWSSVLKVAHHFKFVAIHSLVISRLESLTTAIQRVVLVRKYRVVQWHPDTLLDMCMRDELPDDTEVARLKYDTFVKTACTREMLLTTDLQDDEDRMGIINDIFGLDDVGSLPPNSSHAQSAPPLEPTRKETQVQSCTDTRGMLKKRKRNPSVLDGDTDGERDEAPLARKKSAGNAGISAYEVAPRCASGCEWTICLRMR